MAKLVSQAAALVPQLASAAKPKLAVFAKYAKVELIPPSPTELPQVIKGYSNILRSARTGKWKEMSVQECWLNTLVTVEVICWFFAGECIGKGSLIGYQV